MATRGIRNNNPFNIRRGSSNWLGLIDGDKSFCTFDTMQHGIRAMLKLLRTYRNKYGIDSIEQTISRFAPVKDGNDTKSYINFVCKLSKCTEHNLVSAHEFDVLQAMAIIESDYHLTWIEYNGALASI